MPGVLEQQSAAILDGAPPGGEEGLPLGLAGFGGDFYGVRRFAERDHKNIVQWKTYDHGGHFAAHKVPDVYVSDVRAFFRAIGR